MSAASPRRDARAVRAEVATPAGEGGWAAAFAAVLAGLVLVLGAEGARGDLDPDEDGGVSIVRGEVVTEADGPGAVAETVIRETREDALATGRVVRNIVIRGDVTTRANGPRSHACTSIGSLGGCEVEEREDRAGSRGNRSGIRRSR